MKFSFEKEALEVLRDFEHDEKFFQRNLQRIRIGQAAIKVNQMQRVSQIKKEMFNVDLKAGTFETKDIIVVSNLKDATQGIANKPK